MSDIVKLTLKKPVDLPEGGQITEVMLDPERFTGGILMRAHQLAGPGMATDPSALAIQVGCLMAGIPVRALETMAGSDVMNIRNVALELMGESEESP